MCSCTQVTRKLRRFSWPEHEHYMVRCLLSAVKGRFSQIPMVASLAASLSKYHPTLGVALADALLEEVPCSRPQGVSSKRGGGKHISLYALYPADMQVVTIPRMQTLLSKKQRAA